MKYFLVIFIGILFLCINTYFVNADENAVIIRVYDVTSGNLIRNEYINYELRYAGGNTIYTREILTDENATMILFLNSSSYDLIIKYDNLSTDGKDRYSKTEISVVGNSSWNIFLQPIGSLHGVVTDKDGRTIKNALVRVDCISEYGIQGNTYTNDMGSYFFNYLPTGKCRVGAAYNDVVGFLDVNIVSGSSNNLEISLDKQTMHKDYTGALIIILVVLLIAIIAAVISNVLIKKRRLKNIKDSSRINISQTSQKISEPKKKFSRANDILPTLNEKERHVVNFLLENNNEASMAKIYHSTDIAKTSLSRIFANLESKNIITCSREGKLKKIRLTEWFIEK